MWAKTIILTLSRENRVGESLPRVRLVLVISNLSLMAVLRQLRGHSDAEASPIQRSFIASSGISVSWCHS
jgi:hypothetical protein